MSLRRKFTFPERQLKACREHLVLMQTETGATLKRCGHLCFAAASFPSRNQGWADAVLRCAPQPQRVAMVLGHGARPRAADTVLACGAWSRCLATVRGLGAWLRCSARCVNTVLGCVLVPSSGAWTRCSAGGVSAVFGARRSAVLWMRCSATVCVNVVLGCGAQPGRGTWCSAVVLRAGARSDGAQAPSAVLRRCPQSRCFEQGSWTQCLGAVRGRGAQEQLLRRGARPPFTNTVLGRGAQTWGVDVVQGHGALPPVLGPGVLGTTRGPDAHPPSTAVVLGSGAPKRGAGTSWPRSSFPSLEQWALAAGSCGRG